MDQALADAVHLANRPLPKALDGRYDWQVKPKTETGQSGDEMHSHLHKAVQHVEGAVKRTKAFNPSLIVRDYAVSSELFTHHFILACFCPSSPQP